MKFTGNIMRLFRARLWLGYQSQRIRVGVTALAVGYFITTCSGGAADPSTALPPKLFPATENTLTNGLRVLVLENHKCPIVAVQVWYHVGGVDEPAGRHGFAHLFEHMMFRGTDRLGPTDHFDLLHSVGGGCNAYTSFDETCYHESLPSSQVELALWLESERMAFLTVDTAGFNTERKVVEEERRMGLNLPYGDLPDRALPIFFGNHPYANNPIGTISDLRRATPANVHEWWTKWYTPNNATLVIAGDVATDHVRALAEKYFGWIPAVPQAARTLPVVTPFDAARQTTLESENAPAPGVGIVWRTVPEGHPDALALEVLAIVLGGGANVGALLGGTDSSRLYRHLVAESHLAVAAKAAHFSLARAGAFGAGAVMLPFIGNSERTLAALKAECNQIVAEGITDEELEKARNQLMSELVAGTQTVEGAASQIGRAVVLGPGLEELNSRTERLQRLTREDVHRAARTWLKPEHAFSAVVPGSSLWGQLGRLFGGSRKREEEIAAVSAPETVFRGRTGVVRPAGLPVQAPITNAVSDMPKLDIAENHLTNGLRLLVAPDPKTPVVRIELALPFGSWAEEKPGAAAMTLGMLTKGSEKSDEKSLAAALDRYAIQMSAVANYDDSVVAATCLAEHAERAISLLAEVSLRPTFPATAFSNALSQARMALAVSDSAPTLVADRELRRQLFAGHPYGRRVSGELGDLAALQREDLASSWKQAARPDKATLIITGALTTERARGLAEQFFGSWQAAPCSPAVQPKSPPKLDATRIVLVDWPGAGQSEIRVAGRGLVNTDPDKPVADLVSSYFGGSFGSRLMKTIRVEKGATYGVHGGFHASRFAGDFVVGTFTKTPSTAETLKLVLAEVRGLSDRAPTVDELTLHRRSFLGSAAARFETPEQVADYLARVSLNHFPLDQLKRTLATIASAQASQCQELVKRLVDPEHLLVVVVGDASVVGEGLRAIAPVTVVDRDGKNRK